MGAGQEFIIPYTVQDLDETLYELYPLVANSDLTVWKRYRGSEIGGYAEEQYLGTHQIEIWAQPRRPGLPELGLITTLQLQIVSSCQSQAWYTDADGDGWGRQLLARSCTPPTGAVSQRGDCDDANAFVYPGAPELADGLDNNCNQTTDEQAGDNQRPTIVVEELQGHSGALPYTPGTTYTYRITVHNPEPDEAVQLSLSQYIQSPPEEFSFSSPLPLSGTGMLSVDIAWTPDTDNYFQDEFLDLIEFKATDAAGNTSMTYLQATIPSSLPQIHLAADTFRIGINQAFRIEAYLQDDVNRYATLYPLNTTIPWDEYSIIENTKTSFIGYDDLSPGPEHAGLHRVLLVAFEDYVYTRRQVYKPFWVWVDPSCTNQAWYPDADGDGYGITADYNQTSYLTCDRPSEGYAANNEDCDDAQADTYPGAPELIGDGRDNNCNGAIDEGLCDISEPLTVASTCSEDPQNFRSWIIYNPNHCAVEVRYDLRQSDVEGTILALPGETIFSTPFLERNMNIMQIHWEDDAGRERMYRYREPNNTGLRIFTICSDDPAQELRWRIHNPNECAYYVEWEIEGSDQRGSYIAPPGDSYLTTTTIPNDPNVAVLMYYNYHSKKRYSRQPSAYRNCSGSQEPDCTISRELTIASSCSDDPLNVQNWVIYNPHACAVAVRYELRDTDQQGSLQAEPGYTYFQTPFVEGSRNIIDLYWQDSDEREQRYRFRQPADEPLQLFSECSDNPQQELRWRIFNPNECAYYVQWNMLGTQQRGSIIAPPGESFFTTTTSQRANLAQITWYNYQNERQRVQLAASFQTCGDAPATRSLAAKEASEHTLRSESLSVYPMPFRDVLQLRHQGITATAQVRVSLVSLSGARLEVPANQIRQTEGALELDLQQLPLADGLYLLRLDIEGDKPLYQRVIRQR
ncbi:putative metal-binding motif-containing protein [Cesiribacter andamanensis]|uniref:Protein metal binding site n=1 Tax=Cesiribacter andamanensis AMV16 TaxID=1279009 RepID=M7NQU4_9BACT|nr:putative metal-binding motif-containing protein [Cesiribacter andamanensis]EMR00869.1 Protein metal binding site [Cesiribacter andamanensis AMV16]